jgi:hypothetical protein
MLYSPNTMSSILSLARFNSLTKITVRILLVSSIACTTWCSFRSVFEKLKNSISSDLSRKYQALIKYKDLDQVRALIKFRAFLMNHDVRNTGKLNWEKLFVTLGVPHPAGQPETETPYDSLPRFAHRSFGEIAQILEKARFFGAIESSPAFQITKKESCVISPSTILVILYPIFGLKVLTYSDLANPLLFLSGTLSVLVCYLLALSLKPLNILSICSRFLQHDSSISLFCYLYDLYIQMLT